MFTSRARHLLSRRARFAQAPRWVGTRRRLPSPLKPKAEGEISNSFPFSIISGIAAISLGWWLGDPERLGPDLRPHPSPGPKILARLINNPRLPSHQKSRVIKERAAAEMTLRERYPSGEYNIVLDASLPGEYYDDPEEFPSPDHDDVGASSPSPVALYRVEKAGPGTSRGKTVALWLYAQPDAHDEDPSFATLADALHTIARAMNHAGMLAEDLPGGYMPVMIHRGEVD